MELFKVIVKESDGLDYLYSVSKETNIQDTILYDERVAGSILDAALEAKAIANADAKKEMLESGNVAKKNGIDSALQRLLASNDKDTQDLLEVLGLK